jgi:hypothetical protein
MENGGCRVDGQLEEFSAVLVGVVVVVLLVMVVVEGGAHAQGKAGAAA